MAFLFSLFLLVVVLDTLEAPSTRSESTPVRSPLLETPVVALEAVDSLPRIERLGTVEPIKQNEITTQVSGQIIAISKTFQRGQLLNKGEWLIAIDPLPYQLAVSEAQTGLLNAEVELKKAMIRHPNKGLIVKLAQSNVALSKVMLTNAKKNLINTKIRLPVDGEVVEIKANLGEYIEAGTSIASLLPSKEKTVVVPISNQDLTRIKSLKINSEVAITDLEHSTQWRATLVGVSQHSSNMQRRLFLKVNDKQENLPIYGQNLYAQLPIKGWEKTVALPASALTLKGEIWWINDQDRLTRSKLNNYLLIDESVYFSSSESLASRAVLYPFQSLVSGMPIKPLVHTQQ
ncbi:efflux RND transporter periplasmic adaptor subunit [Aliivibrio kagoshimensis]|uniref:efflux RND transporter periplasmic adaptor subunit n=1 Tax=Aliivibrio kagoshimensis TaxID=2910230 RepID=UPI003D11F5A3